MMVKESESRNREKGETVYHTKFSFKKKYHTHTMFRDPQKKMSSKKEMMMQCSLGVICAIVISYALPTLLANVR